MTRHAILASIRLGPLAVATLVVWVAACGGDLAGPAGGSGLTVDLSSYFSGAGRICDDEADTVTLTVAQAGPVRVEQQSKPIPSNCIVLFDDVEVDSGMVQFRTVVKGNGRPLLVGDTTRLVARKGWVVELDPDSAVPALTVPIDTIGTAPDSLDVVLTREDRTDTLRISASELVPDTIFALAAGERIIELLGNPCEIQPRAIVTVDIPADPSGIPEVTYTVLDCPVGSITVTTTTTGDSVPANYTFVIGGSPQPVETDTIGPDATRIVDEILTGAREVKLESLGMCTVPDTTIDVTVVADQNETAAFSVTCPGTRTGSIKVVTSTMGSGGPPNYFYSLDSDTPRAIGIDTMIVETDVPVGMHTVALDSLGSCTVPNTTIDVTVTADDTAQAVFPVTCTGAIRVTTVTTAPTGREYELSVFPGPIAVDTIDENSTNVVADLQPGTYSVVLSVVLGGTTPCILLPPGSPQSAVVAAGDTVDVMFEVDCSAQNEAPGLSSSLVKPVRWSQSPLVDPRRRWKYAARVSDEGAEWTM